MNYDSLTTIAGALLGAGIWISMQGCATAIGVVGTTEQHRLWHDARQQPQLELVTDAERMALERTVGRAVR